ncbi:hypothetical protein GCM10007161_16900 [Ignatzschineria indica]|uniref:Uncharacterized protein n=1 Tax=Ignatzschineria indica TaxID=472583 RepID=A0A2U2AIZ6_9GAMM|nr:hypothetical protein [Ignatzschineria indica]PWD82648.1 hypothetical protein DC082_08470 [Ignatzschineria indica]GGZ85580.1 hypothetical protein GCM10007161_16900 [Ignatzschineria indica]
MSDTLKTAFETLEKKMVTLGEQKQQLVTQLQEAEEKYENLQLEFGTYRQNMEQENARLVADNALLSEKLNKLVSRVESMSQNM